MAKPTVYISGPISNGDKADQATRETNIATAIRAAEDLESRGFPVYCPHRELREKAKTMGYRPLMQECLRVLRDRTDAIVFLPGWRKSEGAREEDWYVNLLNASRKGRKVIRRYYAVEDLIASFP